MMDAIPTSTLIQRDDLRAVIEAHDRSMRRVQLRGTAGMVGGLALAAILLWLRESMGMPRWLDPILFIGGWAIAGTFAIRTWRHEKRELRRLGLVCPECGAPIVSGRKASAELTRAQLVLSTGNCPSCGHRILSDV